MDTSDYQYEESEDMVFNLPVVVTSDMRTCIPRTDGKEACLPEIISPGVQKSGTSFAYTYLIKHPHIARSSIKEVNYYVNRIGYPSGIEKYTDSFINDPSKVNVDFTPRYLMVPESPSLIHMGNRATRFVVMLRDPVDRAYSHFRYQQKLYANNPMDQCEVRQQIPFKQYLMEEVRLLESCKMAPIKNSIPGTWPQRPFPPGCKAWRAPMTVTGNIDCNALFPNAIGLTEDTNVGYLTHGMYARHIKYYFSLFPRENFLFIRYEDLEERGETNVLNEIVEWIGLERMEEEGWGRITKINSNDYPPMEPDEEDFLRRFFASPNEELYKLLGRDMQWKR